MPDWSGRMLQTSDRYAVLDAISWWRQDVVRNARVVVVGAGALGNEVLKNLALIGVGRILVVDMDVIEASNLTRSVLFRSSDAGSPKAQVAARRLRELNPEIEVLPIYGSLQASVGVGLIRNADLAFGCLDNVASRIALNRSCGMAGTPWIDGGLLELSGQVRVIIPPDGPCYECELALEDYARAEVRKSCFYASADHELERSVPTTPTAASIIGALQVQEGVKLLHGQEVDANAKTVYLGTRFGCETYALDRSPDCTAHEAPEAFIECPEARATMPVGRFLDLAETHLGLAPRISFPYPLVTAVTSPSSLRTRRIMRPYDTVMPDDLVDPASGEPQVPSLAFYLGRELIDDVDEVTLARLGFAPWDHVSVVNPEGATTLELSGDADMLPGWARG